MRTNDCILKCIVVNEIALEWMGKVETIQSEAENIIKN